jgi:hypothetical protein
MKSEGMKQPSCARVKLESVNGGFMKNVFKMLGALAIAGSLMGCIIVVGGTPKTAMQTTSSGIDSKTVKIFYKVTDSDGFNYSVNINSVSAETLTSATVVSSPANPRAVVVVNNTLSKCAAVLAGEGCFQIVTDQLSATSISGTISFKLDGTPLILNYSAAFAKPPVPATVTVSSTEGVTDTIFKVRFTAKDAKNAAYAVNKAGITEETLVNVVQTAVGVVSPRAVGVNSVVTCDPLPANVGEGCFQVTLGNRVSGTKTVTGSVSFKLDGTALSLPFSHTFPNPAP